MRSKLSVPTVALYSLFLIASFNNPAVADIPEGSHSAGHEEMMRSGKYAGGHWSSHGHDKSRWHHSHGFDPFRQVLMYQNKLSLTPQQLDEIGNLRLEFRKQRIRNRADREIARLDFHRLLTAEILDEARLQSSAKGIEDILSKQITAAMDTKIAVMKLLTAEQRKQLAELDCDRQTDRM